MKLLPWMLCLLLLSSAGCGFLSSQHPSHPRQSVKILLYADKVEIANKMAMYLEEEPGFQVTPTNDVWALSESERYDVIILAPLKAYQFPSEILLKLESFVREGGGIIGMHDVLFKYNDLLKEIFGGSAGVFPEDAIAPQLTLSIKAGAEDHPILKGVPREFVLVGEHPTITRYKPTVVRLLTMSYQTIMGKTKSYTAAWLSRYGKGKAFYIAPGDSEETRYNPYILRMIANAVNYMARKTRSQGDVNVR